MIVNTSEISLTLVRPWSNTVMPLSEIIIGKNPTGCMVLGEVLEASLRYNDNFILFMTDGIDFEDGLHIYLLDQSLTKLDEVTLSWPYMTGVFRNLNIIQPDKMTFLFFDETPWTVTLLEKPRFALPFNEPRGSSRGWSLARHFTLSR